MNFEHAHVLGEKIALALKNAGWSDHSSWVWSNRGVAALAPLLSSPLACQVVGMRVEEMVADLHAFAAKVGERSSPDQAFDAFDALASEHTQLRTRLIPAKFAHMCKKDITRLQVLKEQVEQKTGGCPVAVEGSGKE